MSGFSRRPCVVGNWKMQGSHLKVKNLIEKLLKEGKELGLENIDVVVCPPFVYLQQVAELVKNSFLQLGAQNVYSESFGAYTGEISADMLKELGCQYVIIGHSERRQILSEGNDLIARKFVKAYDTGLTPILCVGETRAERDKGRTFEVIQQQLQAVIELAPVRYFERAMIAYEPVWAIGTGLTATPKQASEVHTYIRGLIAEYKYEIAPHVRILYGGSVKASNASELFRGSDVDGGLVGGASLESEEFLNICHAARVGT